MEKQTPHDASMRPRPIGRGIDDNHSAAFHDTPASMRPRPIGRGIASSSHPRMRFRSFNEAAADRPRNPWTGEGASAPQHHFNEAAADRPRNPNSVTVPRRATRYFNEAAADRPRNHNALSKLENSIMHFNEAAADRPRNRRQRKLRHIAPRASMRPRPIGRGITTRRVGRMQADQAS